MDNHACIVDRCLAVGNEPVWATDAGKLPCVYRHLRSSAIAGWQNSATDNGVDRLELESDGSPGLDRSSGGRRENDAGAGDTGWGPPDTLVSGRQAFRVYRGQSDLGASHFLRARDASLRVRAYEFVSFEGGE